MDTIFWCSAIFGSLFFTLRVISSFFGLFGDETEGSDVDDQGSDRAFRLFSIHSLTGFFMMFGWVGLAFYEQYRFGAELSLVFAFAAGVVTMVISSYIFRMARLFVSQGTDYQIGDLKNQRGTVYQKIPVKGVGKIQIIVNGIQREVKAISENGEELASFVSVIVVRIINRNLVSVKKIEG